MIKRKIGQTAILNRLSKLEEIQAIKSLVESVYITVEEDGRLSIGLGADAHYFETMFEVESYLLTLPGVTNKTILFIDDIACASDDLYLPGEPLLYYISSADRKRFIAVALTPEEWLSLYIELIQKLLVTSVEKPDMVLIGFDDPALKDLIENKNSMSIEQLIERYKDHKWFAKGR